jgi:type III pantothenate kinase
MNLLAIDLGNSSLKIGVFKDKNLIHHWHLATDQVRLSDEYGLQLVGLLEQLKFDPRKLDGICLSSVVPPLTIRITQACEEYLSQKPLIIHHKLNSGLKILYEDPAAVGSDRICDAVAVLSLYGGPACIIDFGTAITFNALTALGEYLGGAITANIGIAAEALYQKAYKLSRVDLERPPSIIGRNTTHAMQSGLLFGYVSLVEGMVDRFRKELGKEMKVIGTGGAVEIIARETKSIQIVAPLLTLEGIRMIWEMNRK